MSTQEIFNYRKVSDGLITAGQPTEDQLRDAAAEGYTAVINLATKDPLFSLENEKELVHSLGMGYAHIPVEWDSPTQSDFAAFEKAMQENEGGRILIHCAANYRVTAFYGLYAMKHLGWTESQADALRASIWQDSNYPIWEDFIRRVKAEK